MLRLRLVNEKGAEVLMCTGPDRDEVAADFCRELQEILAGGRRRKQTYTVEVERHG